MIKVCSLFSGSSGNCIFISSKETAILIDAGLSGRKIEKAIESIGESFDNISAILLPMNIVTIYTERNLIKTL